MPHHAYRVILLVYLVTKTAPACADSPSRSTDNVTNQTDDVLQPVVNSPQQSISYNTTEPPPVMQSNNTAPMIMSLDTTTTEDVCVSLCSIQQGGDACNCDVPIVPG